MRLDLSLVLILQVCQQLSAYFQEITSTALKLRLNRLSHADLEEFKAEHLSEVESLRTDQGIWIEFPTHFSVATRRS